MIRVGVEEPEGRTALPWAPFPNLLAIDATLRDWAHDTLGLEAIAIHDRFVERPDPAGALYYLIESGPLDTVTASMEPNAPLRWLDTADALRRLAQPDRAALAKAVRFLAGQH